MFFFKLQSRYVYCHLYSVVLVCFVDGLRQSESSKNSEQSSRAVCCWRNNSYKRKFVFFDTANCLKYGKDQLYRDFITNFHATIHLWGHIMKWSCPSACPIRAPIPEQKIVGRAGVVEIFPITRVSDNTILRHKKIRGNSCSWGHIKSVHIVSLNCTWNQTCCFSHLCLYAVLLVSIIRCS